MSSAKIVKTMKHIILNLKYIFIFYFLSKKERRKTFVIVYLQLKYIFKFLLRMSFPLYYKLSYFFYKK